MYEEWTAKWEQILKNRNIVQRIKFFDMPCAVLSNVFWCALLSFTPYTLFQSYSFDLPYLKVTLHKACAAWTQIYFSSDCIEFLKAYCRMMRKLCVIWRRICKFMTCKVFWRALCGVALNTVLHWEVVWKFHYNNFWNNLKGVA